MPEEPRPYPASFYALDKADQKAIEDAASCEHTFRVVSLTEIYTQKKACAGYRADFRKDVDRIGPLEGFRNQFVGGLKVALWIIGAVGGLGGLAALVALIARALAGGA